MNNRTTPTRLQNYIGGHYVPSSATEYLPVHNPSTGEVIAETPVSLPEDVDQAVETARQAFPGWSGTPVTRRAALLFHYKALLEQHFDELAALVTLENGKTLAEAQGDVRRGIEVVDFACGIPHLIKGETLPKISESMDGSSTYEPVGVCVGITPFNFPAMVPMWMFPLALACGNTFVLKPSEKVPLTANRLAELATEAGVPAGVFNVLHGSREVVDGLCTHPAVAAVSFVGSSRIAQHVYNLGCTHGKRVQAAGGAKNFMLVMPDAAPDSTIRAIMGASFGCAGQRCMAGSVVLGVEAAGEAVVRRLRDSAKGMKLLPTHLHPESDMGPVINAQARDRLVSVLDRVEGEGAEIALDGRRNLPPQGFFLAPSILDRVSPEMPLANEELFGPVAVLIEAEDEEDALRIANDTRFGLGASVYTRDRERGERIAREVLEAGNCFVNGMVRSDPRLPFGGIKESGYGRELSPLGIRAFTNVKTVWVE